LLGDPATVARRSDNRGVRLVGRREEQESLSEQECYAHSYGRHLPDHVEPIRLEQAARPARLASNEETIRHVSSDLLKRQFLDRLEARKRPRPTSRKR
jgi:hypothetical protein